MKKLFLMLSITGTVLLGTAQDKPATPPAQTPAAAPDPNAPEFKWDGTTLDYGTVTKSDETAAAREFKFTNTGKSPLIISGCKGSCGCTVPTCPTEPILPGGKGSIKVHYDVNRVGPFTKTITVTSNAKNPNETLKITGTVNDPNAGKEVPATPVAAPSPLAPH
ncbi:MAG: DUF1573 domain-containing protein [Bacteroidota bacterium]